MAKPPPPPVSPAIQRVLVLMAKDIPMLAVELARAQRRFVPQMDELDERAHQKRIEQTLRALIRGIDTGDFKDAVATTRVNMQLAMPAGMQKEDFIHVFFVYFAVVRRWCLRHASDALRALGDWDELEDLVLPAVGHFIRMAGEVEEPTLPGAQNPFLPSSRNSNTQD